MLDKINKYEKDNKQLKYLEESFQRKKFDLERLSKYVSDYEYHYEDIQEVISNSRIGLEMCSKTVEKIEKNSEELKENNVCLREKNEEGYQ